MRFLIIKFLVKAIAVNRKKVRKGKDVNFNSQ